MQKFFNSVFNSEKTMRIATLFGVLIGLLMCILYLMDGQYTQAVCSAMTCICIFVLNSSYKDHEKNVMKGMMGALLMVILLNNSYVLFDEMMTETHPGIAAVIIVATSLVLSAIVFVNHFVINSDHHSSPARVLFNNILIFILIILRIPQMILPFIDGTITEVNTTAVSAVMYLFAYVVVICIETKLDTFRLAREANGWTEKK